MDLPGAGKVNWGTTSKVRDSKRVLMPCRKMSKKGEVGNIQDNTLVVPMLKQLYRSRLAALNQLSCLSQMQYVPLLQERKWKSNFAESKGGETGWKGRQQCLPIHSLCPNLLRLLHHCPHGEVHQEGARGYSLWKLLCRVRGEKMVRKNPHCGIS